MYQITCALCNHNTIVINSIERQCSINFSHSFLVQNALSNNKCSLEIRDNPLGIFRKDSPGVICIHCKDNNLKILSPLLQKCLLLFQGFNNLEHFPSLPWRGFAPEMLMGRCACHHIEALSLIILRFLSYDAKFTACSDKHLALTGSLCGGNWGIRRQCKLYEVFILEWSIPGFQSCSHRSIIAWLFQSNWLTYFSGWFHHIY